MPPPTHNRSMNHVAVSVPSADDCVAFYKEIFGFELIGNTIHHIKRSETPDSAIFAIYPDSLQEVKIAYMATGNGVGFEVFEFVEPKSYTPTKTFDYAMGAFFHICVTDPDPDSLAEKVVNAKGKRIGVTVDPTGKGTKCLYVTDPWGNVVEVLDISFERLATLSAPESR